MPPTTWKLTVTDGPTPDVRTGLSTLEARSAMATLMRGGTLPAAEPTPAPEAIRVERTPADERELVAA